MIRNACSAWSRLTDLHANLASIGLLVLRVGFGGLMITHGWAKLMAFSDLSTKFPDPIGLGSPVALALAIFAEFFCSCLLIAGFATRLALIPLIITMCVAAFVVNGGEPLAKKELALLYLIPFIGLLFTGPGKFSIDHMITRTLCGAPEEKSNGR